MSRRSESGVTTERLAAYLEGDAEAHERTEIDEALAQDPQARQVLAEIRELEHSLSAPVPDLEERDMRQRVQVAIAARLVRRPRVAVLRWSSGLAALAAVVCLGWIARPRAVETSEFRAKGAIRTTDGQHWSGIHVYRALSEDGEAEQVDGTLSFGERLLFSYTNLAHPPFTHLTIFAIDARGHEHFYYPVLEGLEPDPVAVSIRAGADEVLPDLIPHNCPPGPIELRAVFTRQVVRVSDVERAQLEHRGDLQAGLPPGTSIHTLHLQVSTR